MGEPAEKREWYTTQEAADYLRISPKALLMAVSRNRIKPDCPGGQGRTRSHRFHVTTLAAYFGRGKTGP